MTGEAGLAKNATAPWHPASAFGATTEHSHQAARRYQLVRDGTGRAPQWEGGSSRERAGNVFVAFGDDAASNDAVAVENTAGFASIDKSTLDAAIPREVEEQLDRLCLAAHDEQFEAGVESRFSRALQQLLWVCHPTAVLRSLKTRLIDGDAGPEVLSEILQWASRQEAGAIRIYVIDLVTAGLHHASALVRDAAALALACLDERAAAAHLRQALEREVVPELREDLKDLVRSLES